MQLLSDTGQARRELRGGSEPPKGVMGVWEDQMIGAIRHSAALPHIAWLFFTFLPTYLT